ncbi:MAG TPA: response regulator transcription factor [Chloroflexota bacterium]|nr:response regulator transcription factor [Chloroflexota bacterium]
MTARVLVVDDDDAIRTTLARSLGAEGYAVEVAADGREALQVARDRTPDLVVLDLMIPGITGLDVCRRLRAAEQHLPIVLLTARDAVADRVTGLEAGADDYLVKPFAFEELLARVRVCLRRSESSARSGHELRFADLRLDPSVREAVRGRRRFTLTPTELELLRLFLQYPRTVLSRQQIFERVWGYDLDDDSKLIEVYVRYLREKLEAGGEPRLIHTVRGAGYILRQDG